MYLQFFYRTYLNIMDGRSIPDRWLDYKPVGRQIEGTRFIAFKVPLKKHISDSVPKEGQLTCDSLLEKVPNLGLVIDLTNTNRYYNAYEFTKYGVTYKKLMIPGHKIPPEDLVRRFRRIVWDYFQENSNNSSLIGVHCTHGVNRTGYLICDFMVSELNFHIDDALQRFQEARGHKIERQKYRDNLHEKYQFQRRGTFKSRNKRCTSSYKEQNRSNIPLRKYKKYNNMLKQDATRN